MPDETPSERIPSSDELGTRLQGALGDDYVVERQLGAGGFAVVYLVRDVHLKRKLAVKLLSPDLVASQIVRERFQREAEIVAQLSHPNIVPLHFIGNKDDLVYLVMEAVGGGSLADRLEREHRLSVEDATRILCEVAAALAHAHKRGVVHRDIKPQNVLLDAESGRALVTDFGIARTADGGSMTATGMVVGTPTYLSPEQVTGEPADHRADIYALGVMAYEMLAGAPPFTGATPTAVLMKRLTTAPEPIRGLRPDVPESLAELLDACLAPDPAERIANASDIVRSLTGHSPVSGVNTTLRIKRVVPPARDTRKLALVGGAVALMGLAGTLAWATLGARSAPPPPAPVDSAMVLIPAGTYVIGSDEGPADARPAHAVALRAFGLDRHEVTVGEYLPFTEAGRAPAPWADAPDPRQPVTGVLFAEAESYCSWRHPAGGRLPTEDEWEAAARGIGQRRYPWGNDWDATAANVAAVDGRAVPVGGYPRGRTPEGVEDLIGNVWEWTSSPFRAYGDTTRRGDDLRVIRGGAYNSYREVATAVFRGRARTASARADLASTGFRCAMTAR